MALLTLRQARMVRGMSLATMGRKAKLDPQTVRYVERGDRVPRPATMKRLADALGLELVEIAEFHRAIFDDQGDAA